MYNALFANLKYIDELDEKTAELVSMFKSQDLDSLRQLLLKDNKYLNADLFEKVESGGKIICHSAFYLIINAMHKVMDNIKKHYAKVKAKNDYSYSKYYLAADIFRLQHCWKFLCRAFETESDEIFYSNDREEDIKLLEENVRTVYPRDFLQHEKNMDNYIEQSGKFFGMLEKVYTEPLEPAKFYKLFYYPNIFTLTQKSEALGNMFENCIDLKVFRNVTNFVYTPLAQMIVKSLVKDPAAHDEVFYVEKSQEDCYTLDTIMDTEQPKMWTEHLELEVHNDYGKYDPTKYLRYVFISATEYDWYDFKECKRKNHDDPLVNVGTVLVFIHGGGWVLGNTSDYHWMHRRMTKETGYPIISIEYALAPEHKFPTANSDVLQGYIWIKKYAGEHFGITFDKIIVWGDSAGGHLALNLPLL